MFEKLDEKMGPAIGPIGELGRVMLLFTLTPSGIGQHHEQLTIDSDIVAEPHVQQGTFLEPGSTAYNIATGLHP